MRWLDIFPRMLEVTCHRRDMWRDVVIWTPWCVAVVVGLLSNIFEVTDWGSGRLPGLLDADWAAACEYLDREWLRINSSSDIKYLQEVNLPVKTSSLILLMWVKDSSAAEISLALLFLTFLSYSSTSWYRSLWPRLETLLTTVELPSCGFIV